MAKRARTSYTSYNQRVDFNDDELQVAIVRVTEPVRSMQPAECDEYLGRLETEWCMNTTTDVAGQLFTRIRERLLDNSNEDLSVYKNCYVENVRVTALKERIKTLSKNDDDDEYNLTDRVRKLHECVHYCGMTAMMMTRTAIAVHPNYLPISNPDLSMLRYEEGMPLEKAPPLMNLCVRLLEHMHLHHYRRCGYDCYEMIKTSAGIPTQAWKRAISIEALVYTLIGQGSNRDMMACALSRGDCISSLVHHLGKIQDWRFPDLVRDRRLVAFRNGLYLTASRPPPTDQWNWTDKFIPYDRPIMERPLPSAAACTYYDHDFPHEIHDMRWEEIRWSDISTPSFQKILDTQGFREEGPTCNKTMWVYAMIGRLLHDVGSIDNWQCALFFKGTGDTGKSTIISGVIKRFYEAGDVGKIENNVERNFPLMDIYNKYLFVAPEIKRDFRLEQATFQSIISGESCSVAIKHGSPVQIDRWTVPGVFAGNELPAFVDNAASVSRRWVVVNFETVVTDKDTRLDEKLRKELPSLYMKCNKAYLQAVRGVKAEDMWKWIDDYFKEVRREVAASCNTLEAFITSGKLKLDTDSYVSYQDFMEALTRHAEENNLKQFRMNKDAYKPVFTRHNLKKTEVYDRPYNGNIHRLEWVDGCSLVTLGCTGEPGSSNF